jgi:CRISPR-associated protein Cmr5
MTSALRTREQERAKHAWGCVRRVKVKQTKCAPEYRTIAVKAPSLIATNGLGQTLAFLRSKPNREPFRLLYKDLAEWVAGQLGVQGDLLDWLVNGATSQQYRLATVEALALLQWLKRFAEAELSEGG